MSEKNKNNDREIEDYLELLRLEKEYGISGRKNSDLNNDSESSEKSDTVNSETKKKQEFTVKPEYIPARKKSTQNDDEKKIGPPPMKNSGNKKKKKTKASKKAKRKKIIIAVILAVILIFVVIAVSGGVFVTQKLNILGEKMIMDDQIYPDVFPEDIIVDIGSSDFKNALTEWATLGNEKKMSSKNVINVLLIGCDEKGTNTDSMMLVSVNRKMKTLKLISFFRDSYVYIDTGNGGYCNKLNAAYAMGGVNCLMSTIENNYKITLDGYVMVGFESFEGIIDAMGGIKVDVQEYEADYINNYYPSHDYVPAGDGVTLNGNQALQFCRVRGCDADADVSRTRRQRQVIDSILDRVKNSNVVELNNCIDALLPYVKTSYQKNEVVSLGMKAFAGGWLNYNRSEIQMPPEEARTSGDENMWIWVVDYQYAANKLQNELYGESNIVLEDGRTSLIDIYYGSDYHPSNSSTSAQTTEAPSTTAAETTLPVEEIPTDVIDISGDETTEPVSEDVTEPTEEPTEEPVEEPTEEITEAEEPVVEDIGDDESEETPAEE